MSRRQRRTTHGGRWRAPRRVSARSRSYSRRLAEAHEVDRLTRAARVIASALPGAIEASRRSMQELTAAIDRAAAATREWTEAWKARNKFEIYEPARGSGRVYFAKNRPGPSLPLKFNDLNVIS